MKGHAIKGLVVCSTFGHKIWPRDTLLGNPGKEGYTKLFHAFQRCLMVHRDSPSILSDHLENPEHHTLVMGCDTLTPKDIRLIKIQQTTKTV